MSAKKCILLFIKSPETGMVKSRLARDVNESMALSLYKHFVLDILQTMQTSRYPLKICYYPPDALEKVSAWLGKGYSYTPQNGKDLGERMKNAFLEAFSGGFTPVVLVGSDIPDLTGSIADKALDLNPYDAVIGPSHDGGYYLIGFKQDTFIPAIFEKMPWGTDKVFRKTMTFFRKKNYTVHILPERRDIDRIEDLMAFAERKRNTGFADSGTMLFIRNNCEVLFGKIKNPKKIR
jgi:rSAM/selenodomain-associated transferase 1